MRSAPRSLRIAVNGVVSGRTGLATMNHERATCSPPAPATGVHARWVKCSYREYATPGVGPSDLAQRIGNL